MPYISALIFAFLFFCIYLLWQPWHNRLLLPLIILWSPVIAVLIAETRSLLAVNAILAALVIMTIPFLLQNISRPLITSYGNDSILTTSRINQYFINCPELKNKYYGIVNHLKAINCNNVGLMASVNSSEYQLWVLLQKELNKNVRIEHINVTNNSGRIPLHNFKNCEVVSLDL